MKNRILMRWMLPTVALLLASGCGDGDTKSDSDLCEDPCPSGWACVEGSCVELDAGGTPDVGMDFTETPDVGVDVGVDVDVEEDEGPTEDATGDSTDDAAEDSGCPDWGGAAVDRLAGLSDLPMGQRLCVSSGFPSGSSPGSLVKQAFMGTMLQEAGVTWLRHSFLWSRVEREQGEFDFEQCDMEVDAAATYGLSYVGLLAYGNPWATELTQSDQFYPPDDPADFANYAGTVAQHYRGRIHRWELWNEPNAGFRFWKTNAIGDPEAFAALLGPASDAIHEASPNSQVAFGGTFYHSQFITGGPPFAAAALDSDPTLTTRLDRMAMHPYALYPPTSEPESNEGEEVPIWEMFWNFEALLAGVPLWATEVGWPVYDTVTQERQAEFLARSFLLAFASGVEVVCWYNFADGSNYQDFPPEGAFGLFEYSSDWGQDPPTPKPAYLALKAIGTLLGEATTVEDWSGELGLGEHELALRFSSSEQRILAIWRRDSSPPRTVELPLSAEGVQVFDMLGAPMEVEDTGDTMEVWISTHPTYFVTAR